ncbi:MAG: cupin domain-containing protein [Candidatus Binatia bacterium]
MARWRLALIAFAALAAACDRREPRPRFLLSSPSGAPGVAKVPADQALAPDQNIRAHEVARGAHSSVSVVQVRDREQPHVHTRYDLTVVVAEGHGTLWLQGRPQKMRPGDAVFIPKGTPHYFVNEGNTPAVAMIVFAPPFDGPDPGPVETPRAAPP